MKRFLMLGITCLLSTNAFATYNANISGQIAAIATYTDTDSVYVTLANQPTSHPTCSPHYFVLDSSVSLDRRKFMVARLMAAYAAGETVNIGYDNAGNCADGAIRIHRVG